MTTSEKYARRKPCGNCPFRKSAPLAHWHPDEYLRLIDIKDREGGLDGSLFNCHKDSKKRPGDRGICIGWLLDQRARDLPSLALRMHLATYPEAVEQLEEVFGENDCYASVEEVVLANLGRDRELNPHRYR